ncbi:hypothetical protein DSO57_1006982 [Entomophthora muscae]|uniref:Uncharacterized protein n=1 Tax=Entomophthora muscae TaxID=34485 RepID=A0ACC2UH58_9FUNG|nr:hypothetical protein DSO57_1006982 [Entomophthora muscae]
MFFIAFGAIFSFLATSAQAAPVSAIDNDNTASSEFNTQKLPRMMGEDCLSIDDNHVERRSYDEPRYDYNSGDVGKKFVGSDLVDDLADSPNSRNYASSSPYGSQYPGNNYVRENTNVIGEDSLSVSDLDEMPTYFAEDDDSSNHQGRSSDSHVLMRYD